MHTVAQSSFALACYSGFFVSVDSYSHPSDGSVPIYDTPRASRKFRINQVKRGNRAVGFGGWQGMVLWVLRLVFWFWTALLVQTRPNVKYICMLLGYWPKPLQQFKFNCL